MKRSILLNISILLILAGTALHAESTWTKKADFPTSSRNFGLGFSINGKGYYGMGHKQTKPFVYKSYNDMWEYDPVANTWTQKAEFPGPGRLMALGFSVDNKIYVGFGFVIAAYGSNAGSNDYQTDLYMFDPAANVWIQKNQSLLGRGDIFFVSNNKAYAVNPEIRTLNRYNQQTDTWVENKWPKDSAAPADTGLTGNNSCFTLGEKTYFLTAEWKKKKCRNELWELDPDKLTWKQKALVTGKGNDTLQTFTAGDKVYLLKGQRGIMQYNPSEDVWFTMDPIDEAHAGFKPLFTIGEKSYGLIKYEFWEFKP